MKESVVSRCFYGLSLLTLVLATALMLLLGYWLFWPDKVITVENPLQIKVDKALYHHGDRVTYTFDYCKTRDLIGMVSRALVNEVRISYSETYSNLAVGCNNVKVSTLFIPEYAPPGKYHLELTGEYKLNPIRTYTIYLQTVDFMVVDE